jgi:hypothetical protein
MAPSVRYCKSIEACISSKDWRQMHLPPQGPMEHGKSHQLIVLSPTFLSSSSSTYAQYFLILICTRTTLLRHGLDLGPTCPIQNPFHALLQTSIVHRKFPAIRSGNPQSSTNSHQGGAGLALYLLKSTSKRNVGRERTKPCR